MALKREMKYQKNYQDYLHKTGGVHKSSMSYYQWKKSKGLLEKEKPVKVKKNTALQRIKTHKESEMSSLEEALSEKELKKFGMHKKK